MVCLQWPGLTPRPRQRPRPMELGSMIRVYTEVRPKTMQIFIGSVHIFSVSVSGNVNEL